MNLKQTIVSVLAVLAIVGSASYITSYFVGNKSVSMVSDDALALTLGGVTYPDERVSGIRLSTPVASIVDNTYSNGLFQETPVRGICKDNDAGVFVYGKSNTVPTIGRGSTDSCTGPTKVYDGKSRQSQIKEFYCPVDGAPDKVKSVVLECPYGCSNGACVVKSGDYNIPQSFGSLNYVSSNNVDSQVQTMFPGFKGGSESVYSGSFSQAEYQYTFNGYRYQNGVYGVFPITNTIPAVSVPQMGAKVIVAEYTGAITLAQLKTKIQQVYSAKISAMDGPYDRSFRMLTEANIEKPVVYVEYMTKTASAQNSYKHIIAWVAGSRVVIIEIDLPQNGKSDYDKYLNMSAWYSPEAGQFKGLLRAYSNKYFSTVGL